MSYFDMKKKERLVLPAYLANGGSNSYEEIIFRGNIRSYPCSSLQGILSRVFGVISSTIFGLIMGYLYFTSLLEDYLCRSSCIFYMMRKPLLKEGFAEKIPRALGV
jgi:membrane protease YdiL (CAAX protease family)